MPDGAVTYTVTDNIDLLAELIDNDCFASDVRDVSVCCYVDQTTGQTRMCATASVISGGAVFRKFFAIYGTDEAAVNQLVTDEILTNPTGVYLLQTDYVLIGGTRIFVAWMYNN